MTVDYNVVCRWTLASLDEERKEKLLSTFWSKSYNISDQSPHFNFSNSEHLRAAVQVSPLSAPSTRITVSGVPPFIPNEAIMEELKKFGKFASGLKAVNLGCRDQKLRHVQSLRRQVFMFLSSPAQSLDVSFRVRHGEAAYVL